MNFIFTLFVIIFTVFKNTTLGNIYCWYLNVYTGFFIKFFKKPLPFANTVDKILIFLDTIYLYSFRNTA